MNPTELVERVIELGHERLSETLELMHPDAVWVLHDERPPLPRIPHTGGRRFVEMRPIAWVYEVEGDKVARVTIYRTWEEARRAAGIEPGTPPTRRFNRWRLLQFVPA